MSTLFESRTTYSRAEWISDAVVHVAGLVAALVAVPVLITVTVFLRGDGPALVAISVYGAALIAMLGFSALFNLAGHRGHGWLLRRLDHSAIYLKIAGTYTPFTLLSGANAGWLLAGLWGAAVAGIGLKAVSPDRFRGLALVLYLGMGWVGIGAGGSLIGALSTPVLGLVLTGGGLYTLGVAFYLFDRLPFHYTIWHLFVLAASMVFYAAVTLQVVQSAA